MYQIIHERPKDADQIEPLLELCFGPERVQKTAYKIREKLAPLPELSLVAIDGDTLLGTIRYWPVVIDAKHSALLLGPIAVMPSHQGEGIGIALIRESLKLAKEFGHRIIILVGDQDYYERFGFNSAVKSGLSFPGPVDPARFLVSELIPNSLSDVTGLVLGDETREMVPAEKLIMDKSSDLFQHLSAFSPPREA